MWSKAGEDELGLIAAGVAFYMFLAFVPLLGAVVLLYGIVADPVAVAGHMARLATIMPQQAVEIVGDQLQSMVETANATAGFALVLAIGVALYGAMRGAAAIVTALNLVFDVGESRSWWRRTAVSLAITAGIVLVFIAASLAISLLGFVRALLPALGGAAALLLQAGFWLGAAGVVSIVVAIIYRHAPNRNVGWAWITPGSALATLVWIAATAGFGFYVSSFGDYNATYGSLGAVVVFLTWLYLSAYVLLLGAELNAVLERRAAEA